MKHFSSTEVEALLRRDSSLRGELIHVLRSATVSMEPLPTREVPKLHLAESPKGILFDIYGTLVISQSGEVGTVRTGGRKSLFRTALAEVGVRPLRDDQIQAVHDGFFREIRESHRVSKGRGVDFPEVDIITIWHRVLEGSLMTDFSVEITPELLARLSVIYESLSNISCPMPGAGETLKKIRCLGIPLGIVSNAQFYTPLLLEALFSGDIDSLGFSRDVLIWSYREGRGKPSPDLFKKALEGFSRGGISDPGQVIHVGNDVINDIIPPKTLSMKAALFAGDLRSLKKGENAPLYSYLKPDIILTELGQLLSSVESGGI